MTTPTPADVAAQLSAQQGGTDTGQPQQQSGDQGGQQSQFDPNSPSISQNHMNHLLAEEKRKWQSKYGDYDEVRTKAEQLDALLATTRTAEEQTGELTAQLATRDRDLSDANLTIQRQQLAGEAQLPAALWGMIGGTDEATIKANIEILKQHMTPAAPEGGGQGRQQGPRPTPGQGRGNGGGNGAGGSIAGGRDLFAERHGKKSA